MLTIFVIPFEKKIYRIHWAYVCFDIFFYFFYAFYFDEILGDENEGIFFAIALFDVNARSASFPSKIS